MDNLYLAWWNLENLFDTESAKRSDKLRRVIGKDLKVWNSKVRRAAKRRGHDGGRQSGAIGNIVAAGFTPAGVSRRSPSAARRSGAATAGWRARGEGSYYRGSLPIMFDQLLVSRGLLTGKSGLKINTESVEVVKSPSMTTRNGTPRRFGRPSSGMDLKGASDHLPVVVIVGMDSEQ